MLRPIMIPQIDRRYVKERPTKLFSRLVSYALFEGRPLTTKGRWINPLVSCLQHIALRLAARDLSKNAARLSVLAIVKLERICR